MDILLDESGDISFKDNLMRLTPDKQTRARQRILITLSTNQGEWKFNTEFGIPWITSDGSIQLLSKVDKGYVDNVIKNAILAKEDVEEILEYSSHLDKQYRIYSISGKVKVTSGEIIDFTSEG